MHNTRLDKTEQTTFGYCFAWMRPRQNKLLTKSKQTNLPYFSPTQNGGTQQNKKENDKKNPLPSLICGPLPTPNSPFSLNQVTSINSLHLPHQLKKQRTTSPLEILPEMRLRLVLIVLILSFTSMENLGSQQP